MMFSQASKMYERSKCIHPLTKKERMKIYSSKSVTVEKKIGCKKFSPFNTVSRDSRNSFLLRVTKQANTKTNYQVNPQSIMQTNRRATIDKAKFQRIIGDVKKQSYSIDLSTISNSKCLKSQTLSPQQRRPLTVRDHQRWRQTYESFDFAKQQSTNRLTMMPKLSFEQTTNNSFMKSLKQTIESNFNNFQRFKYFNNPENKQKNQAHSFESDFGHEYLKQLQKSQKLPQYDILKSNQGFIKTSMSKAKGSMQFDKFKQKILTRFDRLDPEWHTKLAYSVNQQKNIKDLNLEKKLSFDNQTNRQSNDVFSKYPIRLSMETINKVRPIEIN